MLKKFLTKKYIITAVIGAPALFLFLFFGPPDLYTETSSPEFCAACHVMEYEYDAWLKTGLHRSIECVDCHLPNDNFPRHMLWKGIDGTKDVVFFYGRMFADSLNISTHGSDTVQENCKRCHGEMVSRITVEDRTCWSCHRRVYHKFPMTGYLQ